MKTLTSTSVTTCQICARAIKANTGTIAHHGYSRPGFGYQTRSCYGAHYLPYQKSRDAITGAIEANQNYIESQQKLIMDLMTNPPAQITKISKYFDNSTFDKPADYDAEAVAAGRFSYADDYAQEVDSQIRAAKREIKEAQQGMAFLQERFDNWKPAA